MYKEYRRVSEAAEMCADPRNVKLSRFAHVSSGGDPTVFEYCNEVHSRILCSRPSDREVLYWAVKAVINKVQQYVGFGGVPEHNVQYIVDIVSAERDQSMENIIPIITETLKLMVL